MTLTPIQEAMCAVIKQGGMARAAEIARSAGVDYVEVSREIIELPYEYGSVARKHKAGPWTLTMDGEQVLTQQEYNQWVEQQNSKN